MSLSLEKAALITYFAKNTWRPARASISRILTSYACSVALGLILARLAREADLPIGLPVRLASSAVAVAGFIFAGLVLLSLSGVESGRSLAFSRTIRLLPIPPKQRWKLMLMPKVIVLGVVAAPGLVTIPMLCEKMQLPCPAIYFGWLLGITSALGLQLLIFPRRIVYKLMIFATMVTAGLKILDLTLTTGNLNWPFAAIALLVFPLIGFVQSYYWGYEPSVLTRSLDNRQLLPNLLPHAAWLLVKLLRNVRTRTSILTVVSFNILISASIVLGHKKFINPSDVQIIGGVLAITLACDLRGIMRRYLPPEAMLLKSLLGLISSEITLAILLGIVCNLPLFLALNNQAINSLQFGLDFILLQILCSVFGLAASTVLVPGDGEVGSQFFTAMLALGLFGGFLRLNSSLNSAYLVGCISWLAASIGMSVLILIIEKMRRLNYGSS